MRTIEVTGIPDCERSGPAVVRLQGHLTDPHGLGMVGDVLREVPAEGWPELRLDLADVEGIDSTGLGLLLVLSQRIAPGRIVLNHPNEAVAEVLRVACFDRIFEIETCPCPTCA